LLCACNPHVACGGGHRVACRTKQKQCLPLLFTDGQRRLRIKVNEDMKIYLLEIAKNELVAKKQKVDTGSFNYISHNFAVAPDEIIVF